MSYSALGWAAGQRCKTSAEKLVLVQLAYHANQETGRCNPSVSLLAAEASLSDSTVKRALRGLVEQGLVEIRSGREGFNTSNNYLLRWFTMDQHVGSSRPIRSSTMTHTVGSPRPTNMSNTEQVKEQELKKDMSHVHVRHVGTGIPDLPPRVDSEAKRRALAKLAELKLSGPLARALQVVR